MYTDTQAKPYKFCVAPMMGYSHRHFIHFIRLITKQSLIFTEMLPADAVCANPQRLCDWHLADTPVVVQLGGSDAKKLGEASEIISKYGAHEINLNMGCPSPKVQKGAFGACLMLSPDSSAGLVKAMVSASNIPVTVKLRIGVQERKTTNIIDKDALFRLLDKLQSAGAKAIYLHAREAILMGLNPKQNRNIPPLRYDIALDCKKEFSDLPIIVNGGITDLPQTQQHLQNFDGVMVGREIVRNPFAFMTVDSTVFGIDSTKIPENLNRLEVFRDYCAYMETELKTCTDTGKGSKRYLKKSLFNFLIQPLFAMLCEMQGAKKWRQGLDKVIREQHHSLEELLALENFLVEAIADE